MSTLEQDFRTLQDQLRIQQSQVRRQRRWNIALGVVVVVGGLMAATGVRSVPDVIQAKKFEVVNDEGKVTVVLNSVFHNEEHYGFVTTLNSRGMDLAQMGVSMSGEGAFATLNGKGQRLVGITSGPGGGTVTTMNANGKPLVQLSATTGGNGVVNTQNGKGQTLVELGATVQGNGMAKTLNAKGSVLTKLGELDGRGSIQTQNGKGQTLLRIVSNEMGGSIICVNQAGKDVAVVGCHPQDGSGVVVTTDSQGNEITSMTPSP